jgi:phosphoglycolate phosphatase
MYKVIVFDFDGTLVDSNSLKLDGFYNAIEGDAGGIELMTAVLKEINGTRWDIFQTYLSKLQSDKRVPPRDVASLVEEYNMIVDNAIISAPEMPGATQLLDKLLLSGCKLILSSATPYLNLASIIERRGWIHYFNSIHGAPASKINTLEQILAMPHMSVSDLAVVGDGNDDLRSADAVGCSFFPVGEARGVSNLEKIYSLFDLQYEFLE